MGDEVVGGGEPVPVDVAAGPASVSLAGPGWREDVPWAEVWAAQLELIGRPPVVLGGALRLGVARDFALTHPRAAACRRPGSTDDQALFRVSAASAEQLQRDLTAWAGARTSPQVLSPRSLRRERAHTPRPVQAPAPTAAGEVRRGVAVRLWRTDRVSGLGWLLVLAGVAVVVVAVVAALDGGAGVGPAAGEAVAGAALVAAGLAIAGRAARSRARVGPEGIAWTGPGGRSYSWPQVERVELGARVGGRYSTAGNSRAIPRAVIVVHPRDADPDDDGNVIGPAALATRAAAADFAVLVAGWAGIHAVPCEVTWPGWDERLTAAGAGVPPVDRR